MAAQFAYRLALITFATVSVRGILTATNFEGTLKTALIFTGLFYVFGLIVGEIAQRVVEENVQTEVRRQLEAAVAEADK